MSVEVVYEEIERPVEKVMLQTDAFDVDQRDYLEAYFVDDHDGVGVNIELKIFHAFNESSGRKIKIDSKDALKFAQALTNMAKQL